MVIDVPVNKNDKCILKIKDKVKIGQPFLEKKYSQNVEIDLSKLLRIKANKIFDYLKKFVGDEIKKGEILAEKKEIFSSLQAISPEDGIIKEINHDTGKLLLSLSKKTKTNVFAYFEGEIKEIGDALIKVSIKKGEILPLKKADKTFGGEIFYLTNNDTQIISSEDVENKIIMIDRVSSFLQTKIEALGVKGWITQTSLPESSIANFSQIKKTDVLKKIIKLKFPYCFIDKKKNKIIFYE